jgi:hypothetical protein
MIIDRDMRNGDKNPEGVALLNDDTISPLRGWIVLLVKICDGTS